MDLDDGSIAEEICEDAVPTYSSPLRTSVMSPNLRARSEPTDSQPGVQSHNQQLGEEGTSAPPEKRQRLDLRVDLANAPKSSILAFMRPLSEQESAQRRTAGFEQIRERAEELKALHKLEEQAKSLKVRNDARERKQKSRLQKYQQEVDEGLRTDDLKLIRKKV